MSRESNNVFKILSNKIVSVSKFEDQHKTEISKDNDAKLDIISNFCLMAKQIQGSQEICHQSSSYWKIAKNILF